MLVCVYCMFYWFFKVCGFFIFILVSLVFFLVFFSVENQRKSILKIFSGHVQLAVMLLDFRTTQTA